MFFIVPSIFALLAVGQAIGLLEAYQMWQHAMDVSTVDEVATGVVGAIELATAIGLARKKKWAFYSAFAVVIVFVIFNTWSFLNAALQEGVINTKEEWTRSLAIFTLTLACAGLCSVLLLKQHRGYA